MFNASGENAAQERALRPRLANSIKLGVQYVDDAVIGFLPDDFVLLGAYSGMGKTQLCCNIAMANPDKRIHFFALEASEFEVERRLKFNLIKRLFYADPTRPQIEFSYREWLLGMFDQELKCYEEPATEQYCEKYKNLSVLYKKDSFDVHDLIRNALEISGQTDCIVIDHAHYFDFGSENENTALKEIAKTSRMLALEHRTPVILAAHLRKRDKKNTELAPGLDEFHGSSDLTKIATNVISMAQGGITRDGMFETFFRIAKDRHGGEVIRYAGQEVYNPKTGTYEPDRYKIGQAEQDRTKPFTELDPADRPRWFRRGTQAKSRNSAHGLTRFQTELFDENRNGQTPVSKVSEPDDTF